MVISNIRISKEEREKQFIKEELMRYHMYKGKIKELEQEIDDFKIEYQYIMNNPPVGGSIIKMPDGTIVDNNLVLRLEGKLGTMVSNLRYYKDRIDTLDKWMGMLTLSQYTIVEVYVCEYQCQDRWHAATDLKIDSETVKTQTNRAIQRIHKKFTKFM